MECLIGLISLIQRPYERTCSFEEDDCKLDSTKVYRASTRLGESSEIFKFIWKSYALPQVKFFS
jgi:hypothetical protein